MKKTLKTLVAVIAVAVMTSCSITQPYAVTEEPIGSKTGVSKSIVLLGVIYVNGNYGLADAAKNGKIKGGVSTVDVKTTSFLGPIFSTKEMIITGE